MFNSKEAAAGTRKDAVAAQTTKLATVQSTVSRFIAEYANQPLPFKKVATEQLLEHIRMELKKLERK